MCGTGHRPSKLGSRFGYNYDSEAWLEVKVAIISYIKKYKIDYVISGMALGFDMVLAQAVLELRDSGYYIQLEAAVPCRHQSSKWNTESKRIYADILSKCDKVTILSEVYTSECMEYRNRYMIDNSTFVLALWNGDKYGGTYNALRYAKLKNKLIAVIKV